jgi:hypothetical protein
VFHNFIFKMKFIKYLSALLVLSTSVAMAQPEVTVLRLSAPGAGNAAWTEAIVQTLNDNGYSTNVVGFKNCQEGAKWLKDNPKEPVVAMNFSDPFLLNIVQPSNPASCNFPINKESLVAVSGKWFHFICGHTDKGGNLPALLNSSGAKIGSWNSPVQVKITEDQMTDIGVKNFKVISYAAGKDMMQAFVSGDIDYIILSTENFAAGLPNASCFATSAEPKYAAQMHRTSYSEINKNVRHQNSGLWPVIVSYNTDIAPLRKIFAPSGKHGPLLEAITKPYIQVDAPIDDQLRDLNVRAQEIKQ